MADLNSTLSQVSGHAAQTRDENVAIEATDSPLFDPVILPGSRDVEYLVSDSATGVDRPECLLARTRGSTAQTDDEPSFAYRRIKSMQDILRDGRHWGEVILFLVLERRNDDSNKVVFVEPPLKSARYVEVKELKKQVVNMHLANGGVENPYNEIAVMQEVGDGVHVINCFEALQDDDNLWIVMPFCEGGDVWSVIHENRKFQIPLIPEAEAQGRFEEILECQQYLLSRGICHGDISEENVLIHNGRCILTNLGCCLRMPSTPTGAQRVVARSFLEQFGKNPYASPVDFFFQRFNFNGFAIDLLSTGVMLMRMLTGKLQEASCTWIKVQQVINNFPRRLHLTQDVARFPLSRMLTNEWVPCLAFVVLDAYMRMITISPQQSGPVQHDFSGSMAEVQISTDRDGGNGMQIEELTGSGSAGSSDDDNQSKVEAVGSSDDESQSKGEAAGSGNNETKAKAEVRVEGPSELGGSENGNLDEERRGEPGRIANPVDGVDDVPDAKDWDVVDKERKKEAMGSGNDDSQRRGKAEVQVNRKRGLLRLVRLENGDLTERRGEPGRIANPVVGVGAAASTKDQDAVGSMVGQQHLSEEGPSDPSKAVTLCSDPVAPHIFQQGDKDQYALGEAAVDMIISSEEDADLVKMEEEEDSDSPISVGREFMRLAIDTPDLEPKSIPIEYLQDTTNNFAYDLELGEGSFSRVYKGKDKALRRKFAVKRMKLKLHANIDFDEARNTFEREIVTLKHFRHPNIARLYAYHLSPDLRGDNCLLFELASLGSLHDFLKNKNKMERLHWTKRINIALDVTRALDYLHGGKGGQRCYHRDVKSSNVCLKRDCTALLIDCGVAKMTPQSDSDATITIMESAGNGLRGTPGYICPFFARRMRNFCSAHEVFSLGVVMAELFTGLLQNDKVGGEDIDLFDRYSIDGMENLDLVADVDESAGQWDTRSKEEFAALTVECISNHPRSRPEIKDIVRRLGNLASRARPWSPGERNRITVLTSDPLVYSEDGSLRPIAAPPNFSLERDLLTRCIKESNRNIELTFDVATDDRLQAASTKRCGCLHFSGHGHPDALVFEDSLGGLHWLGEEKLVDSVHKEPFSFVFVSACYSLIMGKAFVKAGVPHVICCEQDVELRDDAALRFTNNFYRALADGYTVKAAFQKGKMAVSTRFERVEVDKFVLLPKEGVDHDVPLFDAEEMQWKDEAKADGFIPSLPRRVHDRKVDAYNLLNLILSSRLVNMVGGDGTERRNMATAICHYINERRTVMLSVEVIYCVRGMKSNDQSACGDVYSECVRQLHDYLAVEGRVGMLEEGSDIASIAPSAIEALQGIKALVVFDGGVNEALMEFIASLLVETNTKVLVTSPEEVEFIRFGVEACVFDCANSPCTGASPAVSGVRAANLGFSRPLSAKGVPDKPSAAPLGRQQWREFQCMHWSQASSAPLVRSLSL